MDLDGVVLDTFRIHLAGWDAALQTLGVRGGAALCKDLRGIPTREAMTIAVRRSGIHISPKTVDELVRIKNAVRDRLIRELSPSHVMPGVGDLLRDAKEQSVGTLCLATTTTAEEMLRHVQLLGSFDDLICGIDLLPPKAVSANRLLSYLTRMQCVAGNALYIEDGVAPAILAAQAGVPTVLVGDQPQESGVLRRTTLENTSLLNLFEDARLAWRAVPR